MEKKNNGGMLVGLLLGLVIAAVVVGGLYATGNISFKKTTESTNEISSEKEEEIAEESIKESSSTNFYNVSELKVKALDEYKVFDDIKNYSNIVETIEVGTDYDAKLDLTGKVTIRKHTTEGWITGDLNVSNVIDIVKFNVPDENSGQLLYLLTDDGSVYSYKFGNADTKNYNATKVDNIANVKKIFISNYAKENAGSSWALFAITENNDCIMLKGESV